MGLFFLGVEVLWPVFPFCSHAALPISLQTIAGPLLLLSAARAVSFQVSIRFVVVGVDLTACRVDLPVNDI
jgi:hypothetical protein